MNLGMVFHSGSFYDKAAQCYKLTIKRDKSAWIWDYYLGYLSKEQDQQFQKQAKD